MIGRKGRNRERKEGGQGGRGRGREREEGGEGEWRSGRKGENMKGKREVREG